MTNELSTVESPLLDGRLNADDATFWLSAIIENSFDAILSKTLDGIITSWNGGAERLFGYMRHEAVGQPISLIIPDDKRSEEDEILAQLRRGDRIELYETVRMSRDGQLIPVEMTISPVCDSSNRIIGVSTIARDISERQKQAEAQILLLREMNHRIKNLMTIVQSLISVGRRRTENLDDFADGLIGQVQALASAHQLVLGDFSENTTLTEVLEAILLPYNNSGRIAIDAIEAPVRSGALTSLALILHELATNAVKYGGLSQPAGRLVINAWEEKGQIVIHWCETGGIEPDGDQQGFGSRLLHSAIKGLEGTCTRQWDDGTFETTLLFPTTRLAG